MTTLQVVASLAVVMAIPGSIVSLFAYLRWKVERKPGLVRLLSLWAWYAAMFTRNLLVVMVPMTVYLFFLEPRGWQSWKGTFELSSKLTFWILLCRLGCTVGDVPLLLADRAPPPADPTERLRRAEWLYERGQRRGEDDTAAARRRLTMEPPSWN